MELDEVGYSSRKLAEEIHRQLAPVDGAIPIRDIARALDITEIKVEPLVSFEGALLTDPERSYGSILVNSQSGHGRRKFTIAHELLHFLNDKHEQTEGWFKCRTQDFSRNLSNFETGMSRHQRQEAEANRFAIELLAPTNRFRPYLLQDPDLKAVVELAASLDISKEAIARRFRELLDVPIAMVFHRDGVVRYIEKHDGFPRLTVWNKDRMPVLDVNRDERGLTKIESVSQEDWFAQPTGGQLSVQTLFQQDGFGITLLLLDLDEDEESEAEDTFDRYSRWG
jgi:hypothetical protein